MLPHVPCLRTVLGRVLGARQGCDDCRLQRSLRCAPTRHSALVRSPLRPLRKLLDKETDKAHKPLRTLQAVVHGAARA